MKLAFVCLITECILSTQLSFCFTAIWVENCFSLCSGGFMRESFVLSTDIMGWKSLYLTYIKYYQLLPKRYEPKQMTNTRHTPLQTRYKTNRDKLLYGWITDAGNTHHDALWRCMRLPFHYPPSCCCFLLRLPENHRIIWLCIRLQRKETRNTDEYVVTRLAMSLNDAQVVKYTKEKEKRLVTTASQPCVNWCNGRWWVGCNFQACL